MAFARAPSSDLIPGTPRWQRALLMKAGVIKQAGCDKCKRALTFGRDAYAPSAFRVFLKVSKKVKAIVQRKLCVGCFTKRRLKHSQRTSNTLVSEMAVVSTDATVQPNTTLATALETVGLATPSSPAPPKSPAQATPSSPAAPKSPTQHLYSFDIEKELRTQRPTR